MTQNERTAQIDRQFDISFGVFDGAIRDEQATIAGQRGGRGSGAGGREGAGSEGANGGAGGDSQGGGAEGSGNGSGRDGSGNGEGNREGNGQNGNGSGQSGQGQQGQGNGQGGGGGYGGGAGGGSGPNTVPADIPDGSDDDVVARQLREAAMNETDPELRERLWQEYRNYKKSAG
jgi:hypothetical protein